VRPLSKLMSRLGSNRSRGYCLEMICADFLAGANLDNSGDPDVLVRALTSSFQVLSQDQRLPFSHPSTSRFSESGFAEKSGNIHSACPRRPGLFAEGPEIDRLVR